VDCGAGHTVTFTVTFTVTVTLTSLAMKRKTMIQGEEGRLD
jgi:hypothetical protein